MLLWALLASRQITMRKVDGWQTLDQPIAPMPLDLAPGSGANQTTRRTPLKNFHHLPDTTTSRLLDQPRPDDAVVVAKYGRISLSIQDLLEIVDDVPLRRAEFLSLDDNIVTTNPASQLVFHVFASIALCEHDRISVRTCEGLAARKPGRIGS